MAVMAGLSDLEVACLFNASIHMALPGLAWLCHDLISSQVLVLRQKLKLWFFNFNYGIHGHHGNRGDHGNHGSPLKHLILGLIRQKVFLTTLNDKE
jgi:hypothetical protein